MIKSRFVALIATSAILMPTLTACASTGGLSGPPREASMTPQQLAQTATERDVILDTQMHFNDTGMALPPRPMSSTEAVMTAQIEQHCLMLAHDRIRGTAGSIIQKTTLGSVLLGLGTGLGSLFLGLPGAGKMALRYGGYGAASGAASGAFTGAISIEQARSIVNSYCQIMQISNLRATGDRRLKEIIAIPAVGLKGSRLSVDWKTITPSDIQRCLRDAGQDARAIETCRREAMAPNEADVPPPTVP